MTNTIAPRGQYWATPNAPFPLDSPNGHDEVFPGVHCVSDGNWVIFYKDGEEVCARNAIYAAAHFDLVAVSRSSAGASTTDWGTGGADGRPPSAVQHNFPATSSKISGYGRYVK